MGALGIRAYIDIDEGRLSDAKKLTKKILEIDNSVNFNKLRRAMETFIIMDKDFMLKISRSLENAGIHS